MLLYMDEDSIQRQLVALLRKAGHDVVIPADLGLSGAADPVHLARAITGGRVLVTHNHKDFKQLHDLEAAGGRHPGIMSVRRDNNKRDRKPPGIVSAVGKLLASGDPIADRFTILNQYR